MYDFRRMTDRERAELVRVRQEAGHPWHAPPHPRDLAGWYLITAACYLHRPLFRCPADVDVVATEILNGFGAARLVLGAWVFLPNHYHVLARCGNLAAVGAVLRGTHSRLATWINGRDRQRGRRVWYRYSDRWIRSERHYLATVNYLHHNPVKHGWVEDAGAWPWSSLHRMIEDLGAERVGKIRAEYPLADYGRGWDD